MRLIKKEEYFQTVGVLAGMKEASETDRIYEGEELADEMMVFAGVTYRSSAAPAHASYLLY